MEQYFNFQLESPERNRLTNTGNKHSIGEEADFQWKETLNEKDHIHKLEPIEAGPPPTGSNLDKRHIKFEPNGDKEEAPVRRTMQLRQRTKVEDSIQTNEEDNNTKGRLFKAHGQEFYFAEFSLFLFSNVSNFRIQLVKLITWKYFEYFITAMIILNSVFLGMMDYTDYENKSWRNKMVQTSEKCFTVIFTLEATVKIIGMGFIMSKGCYLRNAWNWLDFIVVITSLLEVLPSMSNISGLRTFRLFRPLRNLTTVPSMRTLVGTLLQSMSQLGGIMSLAIFFFMIFAILGVNLWAGKIHQRCWGLTLDDSTNLYSNNWDLLDETRGLCTSVIQCDSNSVCDNYIQYLHDNKMSMEGYSVTNVEQLNWGITNFDDIFSAFLTIFQCITMEGWTPIMYIYMDAYADLVVIIYFVSCIVSCSLFLLNLTVAVMLSQYEELDKAEGVKDFGELEDQAKKAKLPARLIKFIIENDMVVGKPKKSDEEAHKFSYKRVMDALKSTTPVPQAQYYQAPIVKICFKVTVHPIFQTLVMLVIIMNTVILAMDKYPAHPSSTQAVLDYINLVFTVFFTLEIMIKGVGLGLHAFCKEGFNLFDLAIVIISLLEISLSDGGGSFSALRAFRLFRIFKLFRVGDLRVLIDSIVFTITTIGNYTVLLILFIYVYSLLGMQFFAGQLKFNAITNLPDSDGISPRANFDTLIYSASTIFEILIGDNWNTIMYDCIRTIGPISSFYFITLILFGNIVMLNLFLAILLGNFDKARLYNMKQNIIETFEDKLAQGKTVQKSLQLIFPDLPGHMQDFLLNKKRKNQSLKSPRLSVFKKSLLVPISNKNNTKSLLAPPSKHNSNLQSQNESIKSLESQEFSSNQAEQPTTCFGRFRAFFRTKSLFLFDSESWLRQNLLLLVSKNDDDEEEFVQQLLQTQATAKSVISEQILQQSQYFKGKKLSKKFDNVILVLILLSSLSLALQNPLNDPESTMAKIMFWIDIIFTVSFFIECMIKIIALGFMFCYLDEEGRSAYLRSAWNILDFIVVVASTMDLVVFLSGNSTGGTLKSLKALRVLRALRPLRVIGRNEGLRLIVNTLLSSIPAMTNVLMICLLFLMIFAIMGINFFKGIYHACEGLTEQQLKEIITKQDCIDLGGTWENARSNFDNIFSAMLSLFEMMTTEGWLTVMFNAVDSKGLDKQPKQNSNQYATLFFFGYMIIGSQFILNLFVGIVIDNFNKIKEKELGNVFLTEGQREWMDLQKLVLSCNLLTNPVPPKNNTRLWCFNFIHKKSFEIFITSCIFANTLSMATKFYLMPESLDSALEICNYVFAVIFNFEATLKITALGTKYFSDKWNLFDFFVVVGTNAGILITLSLSSVDISSAASIVRAFRIMRIFVLVRSAKSIRVIIDTVGKLLPQITNIMSLVMLLFFIYAALGINLFSGVKYQEEVNQKNNFRSLGNAFLLLMRCSTGEDWNLVMTEMSIQNTKDSPCIYSQSYQSQQEIGIQGCGTSVSYFYFLSFVLLINMLIMNLTVAAVIEGLNSVNSSNIGLVTKDQIQELLELWRIYDPEAKGFIPNNMVVFLFLELPSPFTIETDQKELFCMQYIRKRNKSLKSDQLIYYKDRDLAISRHDALRMLKQVDMPVYEDNNVHFKDIFKKLAKQIVKRSQGKKRDLKTSQNEEVGMEDEQDDCKLGFKIKQRIKKEWHKKYKYLKRSTKNKDQSVTKIHALSIIRRFFQAKKKERETKIDNSQMLQKTMLAEQYKEDDLGISQNIDDTVINLDTNRKLNKGGVLDKRNIYQQNQNQFQNEKESVLESVQNHWAEEEKVQIIPELKSDRKQEFWNTQQNFGNSTPSNNNINGLLPPKLNQFVYNEEEQELSCAQNIGIKKKSSRLELIKENQDQQGFLVYSLFKNQNPEFLANELEEMKETDFVMQINQSQDIGLDMDVSLNYDILQRKKLIKVKETKVKDGRKLQEIPELSRNLKALTEQTDVKLKISYDQEKSM